MTDIKTPQEWKEELGIGMYDIRSEHGFDKGDAWKKKMTRKEFFERLSECTILCGGKVDRLLFAEERR